MQKEYYEKGNLKDGRTVRVYTITDPKTLTEAEVMDYGATLYSLYVWLGGQRRSDFLERRDVVLGYRDLRRYEAAYRKSPSGKGQGVSPYDIWKVESLKRDSITLSLDGNEVTYKVLPNMLSIEYSGKSEPESFDPACRILFNLKGHGVGNIEDHNLTIAAEDYHPGERICPVTDTPFDFREETPIGERIRIGHEELVKMRGYDHIYSSPGSLPVDTGVTRSPAEPKPNCIAKVMDYYRTARMSIFSDARELRFYSGNRLGGELGKGRCIYPTRGGFTLAPLSAAHTIYHFGGESNDTV